MDIHPVVKDFDLRVADVAEVRSGSALKNGGDEAFYVLVRAITSRSLRPEGLTLGPLPPRSSDGARLHAGDIVIALRGTANTALVIEDGVVADHPVFGTLDVGILRPKADVILPAYLAAYLNLPSTQATLSGRRAGTSAPRLPLSAIDELDVPVPALSLQRTAACLTREMEQEQELHQRITEARGRLIDGLLTASLNGVVEEPVPGSRPARVHERS